MKFLFEIIIIVSGFGPLPTEIPSERLDTLEHCHARGAVVSKSIESSMRKEPSMPASQLAALGVTYRCQKIEE